MSNWCIRSIKALKGEIYVVSRKAPLHCTACSLPPEGKVGVSAQYGLEYEGFGAKIRLLTLYTLQTSFFRNPQFNFYRTLDVTKRLWWIKQYISQQPLTPVLLLYDMRHSIVRLEKKLEVKLKRKICRLSLFPHFFSTGKPHCFWRHGYGPKLLN